MALHDLASFRAAFPESAQIPDALVEAKLAEAAEEIDETIWGDSARQGHGYLAAHLLSTSGHGREVAKDGTTTYGRRFAALQERVGRAYRLVLD